MRRFIVIAALCAAFVSGISLIYLHLRGERLFSIPELKVDQQLLHTFDERDRMKKHQRYPSLQIDPEFFSGSKQPALSRTPDSEPLQEDTVPINTAPPSFRFSYLSLAVPFARENLSLQDLTAVHDTAKEDFSAPEKEEEQSEARRNLSAQQALRAQVLEKPMTNLAEYLNKGGHSDNGSSFTIPTDQLYTGLANYLIADVVKDITDDRVGLRLTHKESDNETSTGINLTLSF